MSRPQPESENVVTSTGEIDDGPGSRSIRTMIGPLDVLTMRKFLALLYGYLSRFDRRLVPLPS